MGVVVGAMLASMGGFLASRFEDHLRRREREQSAALLFGEILAALKLILRLADESRGRGDPYGPITVRITRAAQRELQLYDRNRETLFDLRDPALRAQTHMLLIQMSLTMDGIFETTEMIEALQTDETPEAAGSNAKLAIFMAARHASFDFLMDLCSEIPALIPRYEQLARQSFNAHETVLQPTDGQVRPSARIAQNIAAGTAG